jgi:hypothetical protein
MSEQKGSADFFEFMQNMWNPMGFTAPGMVPPTVDLAAIENKDARGPTCWTRGLAGR